MNALQQVRARRESFEEYLISSGAVQHCLQMLTALIERWPNYPEDPFAFITAFLKRDHPYAEPDTELIRLRAEHRNLTNERDALLAAIDSL